ncbi:MAG TPA: acyl-CoA dehydrogenase family protein [Candidatus Scybalocola faecipullorum]|nr:acyl-CoA dehydrogenase family protein [Candidatus Scybalocola faecipullorum]
MNFHFTDEEQKLLQQIHEFAVNEVAPLAAEIDEQERFPAEARDRLREMNMMGVIGCNIEQSP